MPFYTSQYTNYQQGSPQNFNNYQPNRAAILRRLQGMRDPRSQVGILSRGKNVYGPGGSYAAQSGGGPQYGRPVGARDNNPYMAAINRRMSQNRYGRQYGGMSYGY